MPRSGSGNSHHQKYQNKVAFKNDLHDTSKKMKQLNSLEIAEVCRHCHDVIKWKVTYKKYKPLTQPKTCTKCHQKAVKKAYHTVCEPCGRQLDICCKCGKKEEIFLHKSVTEQEKLEAMAKIEAEVEMLPERKKRSYYRYTKKLSVQTGKNSSSSKCHDKEDSEETVKNGPEVLTTAEYIEKARQKLDELKNGLPGHADDLLADLDLSGSDHGDSDAEQDFNSDSCN